MNLCFWRYGKDRVLTARWDRDNFQVKKCKLFLHCTLCFIYFLSAPEFILLMFLRLQTWTRKQNPKCLPHWEVTHWKTKTKNGWVVFILLIKDGFFSKVQKMPVVFFFFFSRKKGKGIFSAKCLRTVSCWMPYILRFSGNTLEIAIN